LVDASDIKFYRSSKSAQSLGHYPTSTQIVSATVNNLFTNVTRTEQLAGEDYYLCIFLKNTSTETIKNVSFWQATGTSSRDTSMEWSFEYNFVDGVNVYSNHPYATLNGTSEFFEQADAADLDTKDFAVSGWFRTSKDYTGTAGFIVSKGSISTETAGNNVNYMLRVDGNNKLSGGFEESTGTDHFIVSPSTVNNSFWHFGAISYNSAASSLRLYLDGVEVASAVTNTTPDTNSMNLTVGKNSAAADGYWEGDLDEIRFWNTFLSSADILELHNTGNVPQVDNLKYQNKFGNDNHSKTAQGIADIYTAPTGVVWEGESNQPDKPNIGTLGPGGYVPIWLHWKVEPAADDRTNDRVIFNYKFDTTALGSGIGSPGTGTSGGGSTGGTGGNPQPTLTNYKIAIVGDWGEESETDDVVDYIKNNDYDLVLSTGDNSYTISDSEWYSNVIKPIDDNQGSSVRFETCSGNHDSGSSIKSHFKYSNTWTSFNFQNVHVLILDTESDMEGSQLDFAESDLTAANNNSSIDWIFTVWHRPAIGPNSDHPNNEEQQVDNYFDLFRSKNVNLVCQGHNHIWFRSYPMKRSGTSATNVIKSSGPYTVGNPEKWMIAIISGTGGHDSGSSLYDLNSTPSYSAYQNNTNNGIVSVEASDNGQTLTCKFINTGGSTKHSWVMQQG
jgi:Predicted phosphohydrolases